MKPFMSKTFWIALRKNELVPMKHAYESSSKRFQSEISLLFNETVTKIKETHDVYNPCVSWKKIEPDFIFMLSLRKLNPKNLTLVRKTLQYVWCHELDDPETDGQFYGDPLLVYLIERMKSDESLISEIMVGLAVTDLIYPSIHCFIAEACEKKDTVLIKLLLKLYKAAIKDQAFKHCFGIGGGYDDERKDNVESLTKIRGIRDILNLLVESEYVTLEEVGLE
jgi:hypothetical protein